MTFYSVKYRWSDKMTCDFVTEYIKYDFLYNSNNEYYKNKKMRREALEKLSASVGIDGFGPQDAAYKIRILRSTFSQEYKKIKKSDGAYETSLKWYPILYNALIEANGTIEIREVLDSKQSYFETVSLPESSQLKQEENSRDSDADKDSDNISISIANNNASEESDGYEIQNHNSKISGRKSNIKKGRKRSCDQNQTEQFVDNVSYAYKCTGDSENEFDIFGKSVAAQLKNMPLEAALKAQMHVQNYLIELRLKTIRHISD